MATKPAHDDRVSILSHSCGMTAAMDGSRYRDAVGALDACSRRRRTQVLPLPGKLYSSGGISVLTFRRTTARLEPHAGWMLLNRACSLARAPSWAALTQICRRLSMAGFAETTCAATIWISVAGECCGPRAASLAVRGEPLRIRGCCLNPARRRAGGILSGEFSRRKRSVHRRIAAVVDAR